MPQPVQITAVMGRGVVTDPTVITADDLGITRGDGCFDATRVVVDARGKRIDHLDRHLARLARSAELLQIPVPDLDAWRDLCLAALDAWDAPGEAVLKLLLTRGQEHGTSEPTQVLTITELEPALAAARGGMSLATVSSGRPSDAFADAPWLLGGVKTLSYAINMAVARVATERGVDDVLFVSTDGMALEGPRSGLIVLAGGELLTTPTGPTGILASISVAVAFEKAAAEGVPTAERLMTVPEVLAADGVWMASSGRGVCPITTIDDQAVRTDPAMTRRLSAWVGFD